MNYLFIGESCSECFLLNDCQSLCSAFQAVYKLSINHVLLYMYLEIYISYFLGTFPTLIESFVPGVHYLALDILTSRSIPSL